MSGKSPILFWLVVVLGVVVIFGVYLLGQAPLLPPEVSVIVKRPNVSPGASVPAVAPTLTPALVFSPTSVPSTSPVMQTVTKAQESTSATDSSEIDVGVGNNASFLIEDSSGRRTGKDSVNNHVLQEIPHSAYFEDNVGNAETGQPGTSVSHQTQIFQPMEGAYRLVLTGVQQGSYDLVIRTYSRDGSSQPLMEQTGNISRESQVTFQLVFSSAPGEISTLTGFSQ